MNFKTNLRFDEIIYRYALLIGIGIIAGITKQYWFVLPAMIVFLTAVLGYCPLKDWIQKNKITSVEKKEKTNRIYNHQITH